VFPIGGHRDETNNKNEIDNGTDDKDQFPVATELYANAVKLPVWVNPEHGEIVQMYIRGLKQVGKELAI
jgi:hypothetical protein